MPKLHRLLPALAIVALLSGCASSTPRPADTNLQEAQTFLANNLKASGVQHTASGLQYQILSEGTGLKPIFLDAVYVKYRGYFPDNTTFDSSPANTAIPLQLGQVITGWQEGLSLMKEGAKYRLFVHPALAYGSKGAPPKIGPNKLLIFDIELVKVVKYQPGGQ